MSVNNFKKYLFDEKVRSLFFQTLVIGIFAVIIYLVTKQTAYNLDKSCLLYTSDAADE